MHALPSVASLSPSHALLWPRCEARPTALPCGVPAPQLAGLNCLRLLNETSATALAYGIYKTDLPEGDPVNVVIVDVGFASTQARGTARAGGAGAAHASAGPGSAAPERPVRMDVQTYEHGGGVLVTRSGQELPLESRPEPKTYSHRHRHHHPTPTPTPPPPPPLPLRRSAWWR